MSMDDFSLARTNLSQQIADHIEHLILNTPNASVKLPSELKLAQQYDVSRPVVREALKMLQDRGLIALKNGRGAYITKPKPDTVFSAVNRIMQMGNISDSDLTQIRGILEVNAVQLAAAHATDDDLEALAENLRQFSVEGLSLKERVRLDMEFHVIIGKASGNALVELFIEVLTSLLADYMGKGVLTPGGITDAITRHKKILDALLTRNEETAVAAMREHLAASEKNVNFFVSKFNGQ